MVLRTGSAALLAAALALAPGCKQSLFDENIDDDGDEADGGAPESCPEPCAGDAFDHYNGAQGGTSGRWYYLEGERSETGLTHGDMTNATWHTMPAFVGLDTSTAVLPCNDDNLDAQECAGLEDTILLSPSETGGTNGTYPVLAWRAPSTGAFRVSGSWAAPETYAEGIQERLLIYRNGRNDVLLTDTFATSHSLAGFDVPIEAVVGDELRLAVLANTAMSIPIGVNLFVTDLTSPGECELLLTFDDDTDLTDKCNQTTYVNSNDPVNMEPPTTTGAAPPGMPRMARYFTEGAFLRPPSGALNYSGDWTVQFWVYMEAAPWTTGAIYADLDCFAQGGMRVARNGTDMFFTMFHADPAADYCRVDPPPDEPDYAIVPEPASNVWHFIRVSRSTADENVVVCIDGQRRAQIPVPGDADMTSSVGPWLGRNVDYNPAYFTGAIADVRVYTRSLPCPTLP